MHYGYVTSIINENDQVQVGWVSDDNEPGKLRLFVQFLATNQRVEQGKHYKYSLADSEDVDYDTGLAAGEKVAVDLEDD
jgi:hypothetical protein